MSVTDVVWVLPALAGVAIAVLLPSRLLALLLGPALMIVFVYTAGWSLSNPESEVGRTSRRMFAVRSVWWLLHRLSARPTHRRLRHSWR